MVFFHIQNGGVSGAVGMKRTIEFASFGHHQARKARHGADGDFGGPHLAAATKLRDLGPDDERGRQAGVHQGMTAHRTGGAFAMGSGN